MIHQRHGSGTPWEALAGYSRVVRAGNIVVVSGTTAADASGAVQHPGDAAGQARYIFRKIESALTQVGASFPHVIRCRMFVRNIDDWEAVARVHGEFFADIRPVSTLVSAQMIVPEMLVEIEVDAVIA